jgi:hypothetical protein
MIGGEDIIIHTGDLGARSLDWIVRCILRRWSNAIIQDGENSDLYGAYQDVPFGKVSELFIYRDQLSFDSWSQFGANIDAANAMVHLIAQENVLTLVMDDPSDPVMASIIDEARAVFTPSGSWTVDVAA